MGTAILAAAMGTRSGTVALIAVAVVAAVVAAGILLLGGDEASSRESYQSAVVNARDRVDFAYARIARSQSPRSSSSASTMHRWSSGTPRPTSTTWARGGREQLNDRLVAALGEFSDVLAGTSAQFADDLLRHRPRHYQPQLPGVGQGQRGAR